MSWRKTVFLPLSAGYPSRAPLPLWPSKSLKKEMSIRKGKASCRKRKEERKREKGLLMALTPYPRLHMSTTAPHPDQFTFGFWGLREPPDDMFTKSPTKRASNWLYF